MNCAVASLVVLAGIPEEEAERFLARALGPEGAYRPAVGRILTSAGWHFEEDRVLGRFIAEHPRGRFMLTWRGHYGALLDGWACGLPMRGLAFEGGWRMPAAGTVRA